MAGGWPVGGQWVVGGGWGFLEAIRNALNIDFDCDVMD